MDTFALIAPSANRVYGAQAAQLAIAELRYVEQRVAPGALEELAPVTDAGLEGLRVRVSESAWEEPAVRRQLAFMMARSPHVFAWFEEAGRMPVLDAVQEPSAVPSPGLPSPGLPSPGAADGDPANAAADNRVYVDRMPTVPLLQPQILPRVHHYPSDLLTTLKYQGKTNEQFTALMLHVAAATCARPEALDSGSLVVLDPVAGRGTTLNQALMWGLSPIGVDIDKKDAELYRAFLTGWMREHRLKHKVSAHKLTVHGTSLGQRMHVDVAVSKDAHKAGKAQSLDLYTADTTTVGRFLSPRSVDVIVADLPYGVQHGARAGGALARSPLDLLNDALPGWIRVLRKGGAMALAINRHTAPYASVVKLVESAGCSIEGEDGLFRHRVDAAIDRDIVLARV